MSPKSQPTGHTVPSGIKNRTLVTSGKWLQRMGHLRQTASSWPPHTRSLRQTVSWDKWPPHVGSLRQLSASGKWPPHMGLCKQMAAPGEQQPCVGHRGKRPLQTNGSCMHSWCAPAELSAAGHTAISQPKREQLSFHTPKAALRVPCWRSCPQGAAGGHLSPTAGPPWWPGSSGLAPLQTCYPRVTSVTPPQLGCGMGFIWGKRVTAVPRAQALHHILSCGGTARFLPTAPRHPSPASSQRASPVQEPCSGSLQCEIGNREINYGGKLCSQRLNPLLQRSWRNATHIWEEDGRGAVLQISTATQCNSPWAAHLPGWRMAGGSEWEITFPSQAILVNTCCDHAFAHKNNLCIKY